MDGLITDTKLCIQIKEQTAIYKIATLRYDITQDDLNRKVIYS